jgi:hypothetical protein
MNYLAKPYLVFVGRDQLIAKTLGQEDVSDAVASAWSSWVQKKRKTAEDSAKD